MFFSKPKCPKCGGELRLVAGALVDKLRCDPCCNRYEEKRQQDNEMKALKKRIAALEANDNRRRKD